MVYLNFKGSGWPSKDIKMGADKTRMTRLAEKQKERKAGEAYKDAVKHQAMIREEHGERKLVDCREDPNRKELDKIGKEYRAMKYGGVPIERANRELNPEVAKHTKIK